MIEESSVERRKFLARIGMGVGLIGAGALPSTASQSGNASDWKPARHEQDDWMDQIPGKHRFIFDTTTAEGFAGALQFATNYFTANRNDYGLQDSDLAVIIVARHKSTAFAYNDAIWSKYSAQLSTQTGFVDPQTKAAPKFNVYGTAGDGSRRAGRLDALIKRGAHLAVCQMATRAIAGQIARATSQETEAVFQELVANRLTNAHMAPAGIVAVNRAQERGYSFVVAV
jgi:hypothetical protein